MSQPFNNFIDNLELTDLRQMVQQGRNQEALPRLYRLASAYPDNQEVKSLVMTALGMSQPVSQSPYPTYPINQSQPSGGNYYFHQQMSSGQAHVPFTPVIQHIQRTLPSYWSLCLRYFVLCFVLTILLFIGPTLIVSKMEPHFNYYGNGRTNDIDIYDIVINLKWLALVLLTFGTTIWATIDANNALNRFGSEVFEKKIESAGYVFVTCFIMWGLGLPNYLALRKRAQLSYGKW